MAGSKSYGTNTVFYYTQPKHRHKTCFYYKSIYKSSPFANNIDHIQLLSSPDICSSCSGAHQVAADNVFHRYNTLQDDMITNPYIIRLEISRRFWLYYLYVCAGSVSHTIMIRLLQTALCENQYKIVYYGSRNVSYHKQFEKHSSNH